MRAHPWGKVLSNLVRQALTRELEMSLRNGLPLLPRQQAAGMVTLELVNELRDEFNGPQVQVEWMIVTQRERLYNLNMATLSQWQCPRETPVSECLSLF